MIIGGAGHDTIFFADAVAAATGFIVEGGAGIDSITFSAAIASGSDLGAIRIDLLSDSTVDALDTYDVTGIASGAVTLDVIAGDDIGFGSAAAISGNNNIAAGVFLTGALVTGSVANGYMTYEGASASLQRLLVMPMLQPYPRWCITGSRCAVHQQRDDYLFIKVVSEGTSDDFLMEFNEHPARRSLPQRSLSR